LLNLEEIDHLWVCLNIGHQALGEEIVSLLDMLVPDTLGLVYTFFS